MVLFIAITLLFLLIIIMWRMFSRKMKRASKNYIYKLYLAQVDMFFLNLAQDMQERMHMIHNTGDTQQVHYYNNHVL